MSTWMDTPSTSSPENSSPSSSSPSSSSLRGWASNATVAVAMAMNHSIPAGSSGSPAGSSVEMSARFNPSMAIIIVVLLGTFFFMGILSIYVKKCVTTEADLERHQIPIASWTIDHNPRWVSQRSSSAGGLSSLLQIQQQQIHIQSQLGLDKASIQALPIVVAKPTAKNPNHECCVCLGEFQEQEFVRLLPGCGHFFHVECIDLWLLAHTTCPLCRFKLTPDNVHAAGAVVLDVPQESLENLPQQRHRAPESSRIRSIIARVWGFQGERARRGQESANSAQDDHQNPRQDDHHHHQQQQQQQDHEQQPQAHQEISVSPSDALEQGSVVDQAQLQECGDQEQQEHHHSLAPLLLLKKVWNVFRCWKMGRLVASGGIFGSSSGS
ncbi:RING-H2 finger protein ATL16-like [Selaginella moellendorffii]|uniref:RING-H2 finger protein ATL16-like n=1 Tax=Selaginella moellendorffii TaxID=88036 RepID=UPI000D1C5975|nr:RING-H2 finger protein ATL16-like [Selaginella moellendorffii]|eukprot:XP_024538634.1 RING-H2 finger protein ATL16-like [Selaginella moellendorffii]